MPCGTAVPPSGRDAAAAPPARAEVSAAAPVAGRTRPREAGDTGRSPARDGRHWAIVARDARFDEQRYVVRRAS